MPRTVLITGASSGIGLESAIWIARRGCRGVGTVRSQEKARAVQRVAAQARARVETVLLDVTDATEGARVIDDLEPYGLVNNAGYPAAGALEDVDDDEARLALETMVVAPMRLARLALRHMRARGEGRIVNVSSIFGCVATPFGGWDQAANVVLGLCGASGFELIGRFDVGGGGPRRGTGAEEGMPVAEREVEPAADRDRAERKPDRHARGGREPDLGGVPGIGPERERLAQTAEIRKDGRVETPLEHERQQPPRDLLEKERPRQRRGEDVDERAGRPARLHAAALCGHGRERRSGPPPILPVGRHRHERREVADQLVPRSEERRVGKE